MDASNSEGAELIDSVLDVVRKEAEGGKHTVRAQFGHCSGLEVG